MDRYAAVHGSGEDTALRILTDRIDRLSGQGTVIIAIDGRCASGKTTLASCLARERDVNLFHMDDFFLREEQRSPERFAVPGENIDHERFLSEVLLPLRAGEQFSFRRFDCETMKLAEPVPVTPKRLNVIEGVYCMHPDLVGYYDLKVMLEISEGSQRERILRRNSPEMAERFFNEWIPMEEMYFRSCRVREQADLILTTEGPNG